MRDIRITGTAAVALAAFISAATPDGASANVSTDESTFIGAGGQAAPPPAGGSQGFSVRVASKLPQGAADQLKKDLENEGYTAVSTKAGEGGHEVLIGGAATETEANNFITDLKSNGFTPEEIVGASGRATAASTGASSDARVYRVLVAEFASKAEAEADSKTLLDEGFTNVDVVEQDGRWKLFMGTLNKEEDAQALLNDMKQAGFFSAAVTTQDRLRTADAGQTPALPALPSDLSPEQRQQTRNVLETLTRAERGEASADEIRQLRESIKQLSENQAQIISQFEQTRSVSREQQQKVYQLYREFDRAVASRDFARSEELLQEVRAIDPADPFLGGKVAALERAKSGGSSAAGVATAPGAARPDPERVQTLINEARQLEGQNQQDRALAKYKEALAVDATNSEARSKVAELERSAAATDSADEPDSGNKNLIYGGAGLLAVLLAAGAFVKLRGKKSATTATPAAGLASTNFAMNDPLGSTAFEPSLQTPAAGTASTSLADPLAGTSADTSLTFGLHDEEEEAKPKPAPAPEPEPEQEFVSFEGINLGATPAPQDVAPQVTAPPPPVVEETFMPEPELTLGQASPAEQEVLEPALHAGPAMDDIDALLKGTFRGAGAGLPPMSQEPATSGSAASGEIFNQTFDDLPSGTTPPGWKGEYDYASLTVDELAQDGHARCLKFEKKTGTGSASYHCTFPEARGHVVAEFDIRCDDKNKYLLGIYLEKDEDFKQSVHTIVHRLDTRSQPSLRVQGEPVPYELGTWRRVRFELNLEGGMVTSYVDGEQIVKDARLPSSPDYVNTLSIRDNLATTGVLYLDNIKITRTA